MDYELLVDPRIEDGKALIAQLARNGLDVSVAFWAKTSEEGLWYLYIGSSSLDSMPFGDAYRLAYSALQQVPNASVSLSQIQLVGTSDPAAVSASEIRDRYGARRAIRYRGDTLGNLSIDDLYIYPRSTGSMNPNDVVQAVAGLMNRTGAVAPSLITLRDGTQIHAVPVGIQKDAADGVQIILQDLNASTNRSVSVNDVANIL